MTETKAPAAGAEASNSQKEFSTPPKQPQLLTYEQRREALARYLEQKHGFCSENVHRHVDDELQLARKLGYSEEESVQRACQASVNYYTKLLDTEAKLRMLSTPVAQAMSAQELLSSDEPEPEWLVQGIIKEGGIVIFAGDPASFKSFFALFLAVVAGCGGGELYGKN